MLKYVGFSRDSLGLVRHKLTLNFHRACRISRAAPLSRYTGNTVSWANPSTIKWLTAKLSWQMELQPTAELKSLHRACLTWGPPLLHSMLILRAMRPTELQGGGAGERLGPGKPWGWRDGTYCLKDQPDWSNVLRKHWIIQQFNALSVLTMGSHSYLQ
jgi:hypothetical protein